MNQDIITQLQELFTPMALKIGEGAEFGWAVVLKQQTVEAWIAFSFLGLSLLVLAIAWGLIIKTHWDEEVSGRNAIFGTGAICFTMTGSFMLLFSLVEIFTGGAIGKLINPEYYAIEFFINLVK